MFQDGIDINIMLALRVWMFNRCGVSISIRDLAKFSEITFWRLVACDPHPPIFNAYWFWCWNWRGSDLNKDKGCHQLPSVYDSIIPSGWSTTSGQMTQSPTNSNTNISGCQSQATKYQNLSPENFVLKISYWYNISIILRQGSNNIVFPIPFKYYR